MVKNILYSNDKNKEKADDNEEPAKVKINPQKVTDIYKDKDINNDELSTKVA